MAIKAIIFDIGGVIVKADLERYAGLASLRYKATEADLRLEVQSRIGRLETGEVDSEGFWREVGEGLVNSGKGQPVPPARFRGLWKNVLADTMEMNQPLVSCCRDLKRRGFIVAALSNTIPEHAQYLGNLGVYAPFNPCVLSCVVGMRKPDKAIYLLTAKKIGKAPKECLFVDDSPANIEGARAAGMAVHYYKDFPPLLTDLNRHKLL